MSYKKAKIYIGTSGWSYGHWSDGVFYPPDLSNKDWLKFYSGQFNTVEVNASFYHQISAQTYKNWYLTVPKNFLFSVKVSRFLTHIKKLNDPAEPWQRFISSVKYLKEKLGPILVQLPPNLKANEEKLNNFLKIIPRQYKPVFEFRENSWFNNNIYDILKKHNASLVIADSGHRWPSREIITSDWMYLRMHGPDGNYTSKYSTNDLKKWTRKIKKWQKQVKEIYVYFNNDDEGYAVENALDIGGMLV